MQTLPVLALATSLLAACSSTSPAHAETPATPSAKDEVPATSSAKAEPRAGDAIIMNVHFDMVRRGAEPSAALSGDMTIAAHRSSSFERSNRDGRIELTLKVHPREDGDVLLKVHWRERTQDGESIEWSPTVLAKRGTPATAKIDWQGGGGRTLELTVN